MIPPKHVLVAIDFEPASLGALKCASELACACDATMSVLHVLHIPFVQNLAAIPVAIEQEAERSAQRRLSAATAGLPRVRERLVRTGDPASVIPELAKERNADLVVVGAHNGRGVGRLLGNVAQAVAQRSPCAVLVYTEPPSR